jgi:hypothetical protein
MMSVLISLAKDPAAAERVRSVCAVAVLTPEELAVIEQALKLIVAGGSTPAEPEVIAPGARQGRHKGSLALKGAPKFGDRTLLARHPWFSHRCCRQSCGAACRPVARLSRRSRAVLWLWDPYFAAPGDSDRGCGPPPADGPEDLRRRCAKGGPHAFSPMVRNGSKSEDWWSKTRCRDIIGPFGFQGLD